MEPEDLREAAGVCRAALTPATERDWSVRAGDLEWDCRHTLDHIANALLSYANHLATRATARRPKVRDSDPARSPAELLTVAEATAAILADVVRAAPPGTRAFHPAGMADPSGFVAMGCTEIIIHTDDITQGLGLSFQPPADLCRNVLWRIFPWAPLDVDPWPGLRWACGRAALPDRDRLGPDWYWHCAPLSEWDGAVKVRTEPPGWR